MAGSTDYPRSADQQGSGSYPAPPPPPPPPPSAYPSQLHPQPYPSAQPFAAPYSYPAAQPGNGIGTTAGVLGIVGLVLAFIPIIDYVSFPLAVLAVVFGGVGISRAKTRGGAGKGMAITGLVLGLITLAIAIMFLVLVYAAFSAVSGG